MFVYYYTTTTICIAHRAYTNNNNNNRKKYDTNFNVYSLFVNIVCIKSNRLMITGSNKNN